MIVSTASEELEELVADVGVGFSSILEELVNVDSQYDEDEVMVPSVLDTLNDDVVSSPQPQSQLLLLVLREVEAEVESVGVNVLLDALDDVTVELVENVLVSVSEWTAMIKYLNLGLYHKDKLPCFADH